MCIHHVRRHLKGWQRTLLIMPLTLALAVLAEAGHYEVTYAGGGPTHIIGPTGVNWTLPYSGTTNPNGRGGGGISSDSLTSFAGPGSVACNGEITAYFTWTPDFPGETRPPAVILAKTATAQWGGDSGSCSNGLGDPATGGYDGGSSSGTHIEVIQNPPYSFTRSCTPTASASVASPPQADVMAAGAAVSFKVAVTEVRIVLHGVWRNPDNWSDAHILVGQRLWATVNLGGYGSQNDTYTWSAYGGNPFNNYTMTLNQAVVDNTLIVNQPSFYCFFRIDSAGLIFATVNVASLGQTFNLQESVTVDIPSYATPKHVIGWPTLEDYYGHQFHLYGATYTFDNSDEIGPHGVFWGFRVQTPARFGAGGVWEYVQKIRPGRRKQLEDWSWIQCHFYGLWALDQELPYPASYNDTAPPWPADYTEHATGDAPSDFATSFRALEVDEPFHTHSMYLPPDNGVGTAWIAIHDIDWFWKGLVKETYVDSSYYLLHDADAQLEEQGFFNQQPEWSRRAQNELIWEQDPPGGGGPGGGGPGGGGMGFRAEHQWRPGEAQALSDKSLPGLFAQASSGTDRQRPDMKPYQEGVAKAQPFEDRARQLLARGDLSGAEKACREALRLHPRFIKEGDSWLLQLLGEIQLAQGKPKEALASLLPCYKTGGASADDLRLDTALAYVKLGDLPNAQRYFKGDALERHLSKGLLAGLPQGRTVRDMEALIRFAQAIEHERHADSQGALPLFLEAERLNPANRTFILGAGNALMNAGRYGEAANRYSKLASGGDDAARQAKTKLETLPATSRQAKA